jgi:hypothetical protein
VNNASSAILKRKSISIHNLRRLRRFPSRAKTTRNKPFNASSDCSIERPHLGASATKPGDSVIYLAFRIGALFIPRDFRNCCPNQRAMPIHPQVTFLRVTSWSPPKWLRAYKREPLFSERNFHF